MPKFSIITVCYNEAAHIRETLDSIVNQTFKDFELIVVDGGSTDGTKNIIVQYEKYITWWCSEPDRGTYNGMNKGVSHATGKYVIFMNGGDCFHSNNVLENVYNLNCKADVIEGITVVKGTNKPLRVNDDDLIHKLLTDGISHQSSFTRLELLKEYPFDENFKIVADWKFWLQILLCNHYSYQFLNITVADIDMTGVTYSQFQKNLQERDEVLNQLQSNPVVSSIAGILRDYNYLTHNTLVQYAVYLDKNSPIGYQLVRKIAKRVVKWSKKHHKKR